MIIVQRILLIGLAGALGALARYGMSSAVHSFVGKDWPWGTTLVNVLGCLLFGLVAGTLERHLHLPKEIELVLLTGFMGAFTTFSTYMFETHQLLEKGQYFHAMGNLTLQNVVGLVAVFFGLFIANR